MKANKKMQNKKDKQTFPGGKIRIKILLKIAGALAFLCILGLLSLFIMFFRDLPRPENFAEGLFAQSTKIYDRTGEILLYEIAGAEKRTIVPLKDIPEHLKQVVLAAEDRNFYEHKGIDLKAILRAIIYDLKMGAPAQGASTISQQLIRSYFLVLDKTIQRKTREIILTLELERRYDKNQIFEWYLNLIPFGSNLYGVEAASQAFFNKSVKDISLAQSAVLTAIIRAPSRLSPYGYYVEELMSLKDYILDNTIGFITKEEAEAAKAEEIVFAEFQHPMKAPHFVMYIKDYLEQKYGTKYLERAGLKVITTLDYDLQKYAEALVWQKVKDIEVYDAHNAALVSINPKNGDALAMVGSKEYFSTSWPEGCAPGINCQFDPEVNAAISLRQPGSAFKPFVYAQAFITGFTPQTLLWDVQTEFNLNCPAGVSREKDKYGQKCYHPQNYDEKFKGLLNMKIALAQSRNLPSVKTLYLAGLSNVLKLAQKFGITTLKDEENYGLALVLGGGEVKLLEMTAGYSVFANDGVKAPLNFIKQIKDGSGKILETSKTSSMRIIPSQTARQINDILSDNAARAPLFGRNSSLYIPDYDVAVKTGTTQKYNDGWAIGYSPNIVVGVWAGNNDNSSTLKPGVVLAGPIWNSFISYALKKFPNTNFLKPKIETSNKPMLTGQEPDEPYTILHFVNKKDPAGDIPKNPSNDAQYEHWQWAVLEYLGLHSTTTNPASADESN